MEITISAAGDEQALEQFYRWLRDDPDIARSATVNLTGTPGSGRMGAFEIISMTISNAAGLASLAIAYANWRRARRDAPNLSFTAQGASPDDQMEIIEELNRPPREEDAGDGDG